MKMAYAFRNKLLNELDAKQRQAVEEEVEFRLREQARTVLDYLENYKYESYGEIYLPVSEMERVIKGVA